MSRRTFTHASCLAAAMLALAASGGCASDGASEAPGDSTVASGDTLEISEYQGLPLDAYFREYDNSIRGPQAVDIEAYRLEIGGLVEEPQSLTYQEVLALEPATRPITLYCVEGWKERLLFEGVRLADLLALAKPGEGATTLILYGVDGYSTSLPYEDVERLDLMLAARINGRVLDEMRGFPLQLVAESKLGYKWIKWVNRIEISDEPYRGFWEQRGYSNEAEVPRQWTEE